MVAVGGGRNFDGFVAGLGVAGRRVGLRGRLGGCEAVAMLLCCRV